MRKDPKNFRERFRHWKETGEYLLPGSTLPNTSSVESSLPGYDDGKDGFTKTYVSRWGVDEEGNVRTPSGDIQNAAVVLDDIYVTPKGNTWYEVDVPKNYLNTEWMYSLAPWTIGGAGLGLSIPTLNKK